MKSTTGRKNFEIKDFSGGLVTKSPPKNIEPRFSIDCLNVYSEGLLLRRRDGITALNSVAVAGNGNGMYNWIRGSDTTAQWLVAIWGSVVTKMDVVTGAWDGTWDTVSFSSASGTTISASTVYFANYNGVLILSTEARDTIQRMTTSEASYHNIITGGSGTAPAAKFVTVWKNHAWFLNCTGSEDKIVHSAVNSYNNFDGSTAGSNTIYTENDIGLTGWFQFNGSLYVTKNSSLHRFTYTGTVEPLVEIREVKTGVGTRSPRTIKNVSTPEGERVLFLGSNKKLYICDGQDAVDVSDAIDISNGYGSVYMQAINADALNKCWAVVHEELNWYELFVCVGTGTGDVPSYSIVYDYKQKSFWPMGNRGFTAGGRSDDGSGKKRVYAQAATSGYAYLINNSNADAGSAINAYWTSEKVGVSIILDRFDEIEVETASVACTPSFSWRADWESSWISKTMATSTNSHNWNIGRIDNLIQFKISDNSTDPAFKLWTILGSTRAIGGGK